MAVNQQPQISQDSIFELKSGQFNLPNLRLLSADLDALDEQLLERVRQAPEFFRNTPVVIDLSLMAEQQVEINFALLVGQMRGYGMVPIAIQGGSPQQQEMAEFLELAILNNNRQKTNVAKPAQQTKPMPGYARIVTQPIRSGQRIYAAGRDLIITASVSSGAEAIADGNIHIYGTLRGRALAGVKGNRQARIFCHNLQAELVAIAGQYRINEQMEPSQLGSSAQVYLDRKKLIIDSL